jgi:hypothetical protein
MTTSNGVVGRLRSLGVQLRRMIDGASFVRDGYVRVLDPGYLVSQLGEAADALDAAEAQVTRLTEALRPFAEHDAGIVEAVGVFSIPDEHPLLGIGLGNDWRPSVTVGDFRRARAALVDNETPAKTSTGE